MPSDMFSALSRARMLTHAEAPGLMSCVDRMAKKAGTRITGVKLIPTSTPNAAFHLYSGNMWITQGALDVLDSKNLRAQPSKEMQAVIGHELGHAKLRVKHFAPVLTAVIAVPLLAEGAYFLIEKTNERVRESKLENPDEHPKAFWKAFQEVTHEMRQKSFGQNVSDYYKWSAPMTAKVFSKDQKYNDMPWASAMGQEVKLLAFQAACLVPALYACRPFALRNEWEADRFSAAMMKGGQPLISAFEKFVAHSEGRLGKIAKSPLQKSWAGKVGKAMKDFLGHTIMAHPPTKDRIEVLRAIDHVAAARSFGISH